ncbi:MAG: hypothetical protein H6619_01045 [Deltaproteobacteria bacterium]|nr:hypothetical protein [Deltaproteobacteria bacterium]
MRSFISACICQARFLVFAILFLPAILQAQQNPCGSVATTLSGKRVSNVFEGFGYVVELPSATSGAIELSVTDTDGQVRYFSYSASDALPNEADVITHTHIDLDIDKEEIVALPLFGIVRYYAGAGNQVYVLFFAAEGYSFYQTVSFLSNVSDVSCATSDVYPLSTLENRAEATLESFFGVTTGVSKAYRSITVGKSAAGVNLLLSSLRTSVNQLTDDLANCNANLTVVNANSDATNATLSELLVSISKLQSENNALKANLLAVDKRARRITRKLSERKRESAGQYLVKQARRIAAKIAKLISVSF